MGFFMNDKIINAIRQRVANEPYARKMGLKLLKLEPGYALVQRFIITWCICVGSASTMVAEEMFWRISIVVGNVDRNSLSASLTIGWIRTGFCSCLHCRSSPSGLNAENGLN